MEGEGCCAKGDWREGREGEVKCAAVVGETLVLCMLCVCCR